MKLLMLLALVSTSVFAQTPEKVNFTYFGNEGRNRVYLSCYYAEAATENILDQLGAKNVDAYCSGGLNNGFNSPVRIRAQFLLPAIAKTIEIKSDYNSNCYFETKFIENLAKSSARIKKISGSTHCFSSDSRYKYTLQLN